MASLRPSHPSLTLSSRVWSLPLFVLSFLGASLIALNKNGVRVRPIAVGSTFRRLVAKVASWAIKSDMSALLSPFQLGFGVKGGALIVSGTCAWKVVS